MKFSGGRPGRDHAQQATVRLQRCDEGAAVREVILAAFDRAVVADLVEALQDSAAGTAGLSFVAEPDGQLAGHVQLSRSWLDALRRLVEVLVLSPLSVVPDLQRRGIGAQLARHALHAAARHGAPLVFLEGSPHYYQRFGFEAASHRGPHCGYLLATRHTPQIRDLGGVVDDTADLIGMDDAGNPVVVTARVTACPTCTPSHWLLTTHGPATERVYRRHRRTVT